MNSPGEQGRLRIGSKLMKLRPRDFDGRVHVPEQGLVHRIQGIRYIFFRIAQNNHHRTLNIRAPRFQLKLVDENRGGMRYQSLAKQRNDFGKQGSLGITHLPNRHHALHELLLSAREECLHLFFGQETLDFVLVLPVWSDYPGPACVVHHLFRGDLR